MTLRVLCLPFAGGGIASFAPLRAAAPPQLEIAPVRLPGREARYAEQPIRTWEEMDALLTREVLPSMTEATVVYGHSMGALVGYRLCLLAERHDVRPRLLCAAAHRCPASPVELRIDGLGDRELLGYAASLTGDADPSPIPDELLPVIVPAMRADLALCRSFTAHPADRLVTPILAIGGDADEDVTPAHLDSWRAWTDGPFASRAVPGGHFFVRTHPAEVIDLIRAFLSTLATGKDAGLIDRATAG